MLTGRRLEEYLAWAIHGRKPERRATTPNRKGPPRDDAYKAWIRTLPCVACGIEGRSEAAHTGQRRRHEDEGVRLFVRPVVLRMPYTGAWGLPPRRQAGVRVAVRDLLRAHRGAAQPGVVREVCVRCFTRLPN